MKIPSLGVYSAIFGIAVAAGAYTVFEYGDMLDQESSNSEPAKLNTQLPLVHKPMHVDVAPAPVTASKSEGLQYADALATQRSLMALQRELAQLRAEVAELRRHQSASAKTADNVAVEDTPRPDATARMQEELKRQEQMETMDADFQREVNNTTWSEQVTTQITAALKTVAIPQAGVRDLECRTSTCRIELASDTLIPGENGVQRPLDSGLPLLAMQLATSLPNMVAFQRDNGSGGSNTVLYFSRDADSVAQANARH